MPRLQHEYPKKAAASESEVEVDQMFGRAQRQPQQYEWRLCIGGEQLNIVNCICNLIADASPHCRPFYALVSQPSIKQTISEIDWFCSDEQKNNNLNKNIIENSNLLK